MNPADPAENLVFTTMGTWFVSSSYLRSIL